MSIPDSIRLLPALNRGQHAAQVEIEEFQHALVLIGPAGWFAEPVVFDRKHGQVPIFLSQLDQLYRIAAFVVVAIIAIFASFLYQRFLGLSHKPTR